MTVLLEACVDTLESALFAQAGGADRIELCADLSDAGTTPSHGTIALAVARLTIPVFPIVRSRGGGFVYDAEDLDVMRADLAHVRSIGVQGVVIGGLTADGGIDRDLTRQLREDAGPMAVTFHRAFDLCRDLAQSLETLIELGIDRVLTSGGGATAWDGREMLASLVKQAAGRIVVMAGGAINEDHAAELVRTTGVAELHVRAASLKRDPGPDPRISLRKAPPRDELARGVTDSGRIRLLRQALAE